MRWIRPRRDILRASGPSSGCGRAWLVTAALLVPVLALGACGKDGGGRTEPAESTVAPGASGEPRSTDPPQPGPTTPRFTLPPDLVATGLRVGVASGYPPLVLYGDELEGFDIDLIRAIAGRLGVEVQLIHLDRFGDVLPGVETGDYDVAMSGVAGFGGGGGVDGVDYLHARIALLVPAGNPAGIQGAEDACAGVILRSGARRLAQVGADFVQNECRQRGLESEIAFYPPCSASFCPPPPTPEDGTFGLVLAEARANPDRPIVEDAVLAVRAAQVVEGGSALEVVGQHFEHPAGTMYYSMAVADPALRDALVATLQSLIDDGTYGMLLTKWGLADAGVERATVNASG